MHVHIDQDGEVPRKIMAQTGFDQGDPVSNDGFPVALHSALAAVDEATGADGEVWALQDDCYFACSPELADEVLDVFVGEVSELELEVNWGKSALWCTSAVRINPLRPLLVNPGPIMVLKQPLATIEFLPTLFGADGWPPSADERVFQAMRLSGLGWQSVRIAHRTQSSP